MKKKLLFTAYSLGLGGIETALCNLLNHLDYSEYDVTLILEKKEGIFLDQIPSDVKVLEYKISDNKIVLFRKIYNRLKLIKWKRRLHNKYDFSCSYTTYSRPGAYLALAASTNSTLWVHGNYYYTYNGNVDEIKKFFSGLKIDKFNRVVFVSNEAKDSIIEYYDDIKDKFVVCGNFINGEDILEKSKESCDYKKGKEPLFINVGRHDDMSKKLGRIITSSKRLIDEGYKFKILFIGEGQDTNMYQDQIKELKLEDSLIMLGKKKNPFPYYKLADAVLLSSEHEGYPVVFLESMVLGKPILSTKVSDYEELDGKYGVFCDKTEEAIYNMMKDYLDNGFKLKETFDYKEYNKDIENKIIGYINNKA